MLLLYITVVAVLMISRPFSVQSHPLGEVLARDDGRTSPLAPLIFHNLTVDEYTAKKLEHHGPLLHKSVAYGGEIRNDASQQAIVEFWTETCREKRRNNRLRFRYGRCLGDKSMRGHCTIPGEETAMRTPPSVTLACYKKEEPPKRCVEKIVWNYDSHGVKGAYCVDVVEVDEEKEEDENEEEKEEEKEEEEETKSPVYDGYKVLPYESPSPGTWDFFYELTGGAAGHFVYHGDAPNGKKFESQSPKQSNSWTCLGCPSGILHVMTFGFKSEALGFSVPSGKWW